MRASTRNNNYRYARIRRKSSMSAKNVWSVRAGKWFYCPMLVLDSCNVNFSQQCTPKGNPLFAEVQLVFETWRLVTANEVEEFFVLSKMVR